MKTPFLSILALAVAAHATPVLQFQLFMHCEQPHLPDTPDFLAMSGGDAANAGSTQSYIHWREALREFAVMCRDRGIKLNYQSDWNFLEGVYKWEIDPATAIAGITANTTDSHGTPVNIIRYLESIGMEIDAHSHEGQGYSYADVAWLIARCGGSDTGVLAGHRWDPVTRTALDYDDFSAAVVPAKYAGPPYYAPAWPPRLLMGAAATDHVNDPHASGVWRPASAADFHHTNSNPAAIAAIAGWQQDLLEIRHLAEHLADGSLPDEGKIWTASYLLNHRDIVDPAYLANSARATLDTLKTWVDARLIVSNGFADVLDHVWPEQFGGVQHVYQRPDHNVSFSLNWQEAQYHELSASMLDRILTVHEQNGVPLDVFFTTWQTDLFEQHWPNLIGRLRSSALVAQSYHVRRPKPYADSFIRGPMSNPAADKATVIADYESHQLNLTTGNPISTVEGGYLHLTNLQGYAPVTVGALPPPVVSSYVNAYFAGAGAKMLVNHSPPVNVGQRDAGSALLYRPEHRDWKLIGLWKTLTDDPQPATLDAALTDAAGTAASGGVAPWFTGIKLHDNDLFSDTSWWLAAYPATSPASWNPTPARAATPLPAATQETRLAVYTALVAQAATGRSHDGVPFQVLNSFDTFNLMQPPQPRPLGLSRTAVDENQPAGTELARLSGGGIVSGQSLVYQLVAGDGAVDNADFAIAGDRLSATRPLDFETAPVKHLRLRWSWRDSQQPATELGGDERSLVLNVIDVTTDDDDGDGMTQAEEETAGTNPQDAASVFRITAADIRPAAGLVELSFPTVTGRFYSMESSNDLIHWQTEDEALAVNRPGTGATLALRDVNPAGVRRFYRVRVDR